MSVQWQDAASALVHNEELWRDLNLHRVSFGSNGESLDLVIINSDGHTTENLRHLTVHWEAVEEFPVGRVFVTAERPQDEAFVADLQQTLQADNDEDCSLVTVMSRISKVDPTALALRSLEEETVRMTIKRRLQQLDERASLWTAAQQQSSNSSSLGLQEGFDLLREELKALCKDKIMEGPIEPSPLGESVWNWFMQIGMKAFGWGANDVVQLFVAFREGGHPFFPPRVVALSPRLQWRDDTPAGFPPNPSDVFSLLFKGDVTPMPKDFLIEVSEIMGTNMKQRGSV